MSYIGWLLILVTELILFSLVIRKYWMENKNGARVLWLGGASSSSSGNRRNIVLVMARDSVKFFIMYVARFVSL